MVGGDGVCAEAFDGGAFEVVVGGDGYLILVGVFGGKTFDDTVGGLAVAGVEDLNRIGFFGLAGFGATSVEDNGNVAVGVVLKFTKHSDECFAGGGTVFFVERGEIGPLKDHAVAIDEEEVMFHDGFSHWTKRWCGCIHLCMIWFSDARVISAMFFLFVAFGMVNAQEGYAEGVTGGKGGRVVTVRTAEEFRKNIAAVEPMVIQVEGMLRVGSAAVASNKTIRGTGKKPTIVGTLVVGRGVENVILQNLFITNPMNKKGKGGGDGVTLRGGRRVWIDHCTFYDCGDGCIDVTDGCNYITVSWCKFYYTKQPKHRYTMLAMGRKGKRHKNKLKITLHHNWWAENCDQRMPAARKARVHMYNNYFSCKGNTYCTNARRDSEILSEKNYYDGVQNPFYGENGSKLRNNGNIYKNCTGRRDKGDAKVFKPKYKYRLNSVRKVPELVKSGAGAR